MESLLDKYNNILLDKDQWRYYNGMSAPKNTVFTSTNEAEQFIERYFKAGGKSRVLEDNFKWDKTRVLHVVSMYFLGIDISDTVFGDEKESIRPAFLYHWYLTCLYHDYAYFMENDTSRISKQNIKNLEDACNELDIDLGIDFITSSGFSKFSKDIVEKYFKYRIAEFGLIDHGILGGYLIYDRLRKNFEKNHSDQLEEEPNTNEKYFERNNLLWGTHQIEYFVDTARAIVFHNIWFCTKKKFEKKYEDYGLDRLIIKKNSKTNIKHNLKDDPFLFLLIISDTLEPTKKFNIPPEKVLSSISILCVNNRIEIDILEEIDGWQDWFKNIKSLKDWVDLEIKQGTTNKKLIILINE
jgi:hypothetical protein